MQVGIVEAGNKDSAAAILSSHNLFILSLTPAEKTRWYDRVGSFFRGVGLKDMVIFTRQLSTLLEARISLNDGLKTLASQMEHPVLREAVFQVSQDIDSGLSFSQALGRQGEIFSDFFVSMIRSAEVTGNMDEVTGFLADYYEKEYILMGKARSAMIYPGVVVGLFIAVATILVTVVMPQLAPVFRESNVELPFTTRILVGSGEFLSTWWPLVFLSGIGIIIGGLNYIRTAEGRALWDEFKIHAPIFNKIFVPLSIARFANAASILLRGGVPVSQAMEIVSHTVDNTLYRDLLHDAAESVRQGEQLSAALGRHPDYFPSLVPQMLIVGETTGQLDKILARISTFYTRDADKTISNIVDLIQPALMIGIGIMVALLFASILLPILQLTTKF